MSGTTFAFLHCEPYRNWLGFIGSTTSEKVCAVSRDYSKKLACYIELMIDDKNELTGNGRV